MDRWTIPLGVSQYNVPVPPLIEKIPSTLEEFSSILPVLDIYSIAPWVMTEEDGRTDAERPV